MLKFYLLHQGSPAPGPQLILAQGLLGTGSSKQQQACKASFAHARNLICMHKSTIHATTAGLCSQKGWGLLFYTSYKGANALNVFL